MANQGGVNQVIKHVSLGLAVFGFVMLYVKRKMVVVKPPSKKRMQSDRPTTGD